MKKIFTLFFALFMMVFCAKAQYLLQEGFEESTLPAGWIAVDNDGDSYNWFPTLSVTENYTVHGGEGCMTSASWDSDEGALYPDNWLISPVVNLTSNATLTFWVVGQDPDYAEENYSVYVATENTVTAFLATTAVFTGTATDTYEQQSVDLSAYTGQSVYIAFRHHNISDQFMLNLDDVEVFAQPTEPIISVVPTAINFSTVNYPGSAVATAAVTSYNLTAGITATTADPFEVSADGSTYATTATIPSTGGTLYVKFTPTEAGTATGSVTLSSTGATDVTVTLTGSALDCSNITLPLSESFEGTDCPAPCWTIAYGDEDPSTNPMIHTDAAASVGTQSFRFSSYSTSTDYTQYLISPALPTGDKIVSFDYMKSNSAVETFAVGYSTSNDPETFTWGEDVTDASNSEWTTYSTVIPSSATYVGIKYSSNWKYYLYIDNFQVSEATSPVLQVSPLAMNFNYILGNADEIQTATITGSVLSGDIDMSVTGPFEISVDNVTYGTTATIAQAEGSGILYVKYVPTAAGTHTGTVTISTTGLNDVTIELAGTAYDCSNITLPFSESFESEECPASCWTIVYGDNNPSVNTMTHSTSQATDGTRSFRFSSYSQTDDFTQYLISPAIPSGNRLLTFDYLASSSYGTETFHVGFSATSDIASFTWGDEMEASTTWETAIIGVPDDAVYIAIKYTSNYQYYMYVDNFQVIDASMESLSVDPETMSFIGIVGTPSDAQTATITGISLAGDVTVSAPAPFEVSADNGATFGATATITPSTTVVTSAEILVRFNPTVEGPQIATITLSTGTANATIEVSGEATDCSAGITGLPFTYDFNDGIIPPMCWSYGDAENFAAYPVDDEETDFAAAILVDYLITPEIHNTTAPINLAFDYQTLGGLNGVSSSSTFRVGYSTTDNYYDSFTWMDPEVVTETSETFFNYSAVLPVGTKFVAIEGTEIGTFTYGYSSYYNWLFFDNISMTAITNPEISTGTSSIDFGNVHVNATATETVAIVGALLTADITATTTAPFEVSSDNTSFGATATIPAVGGNLYVRYAPTAAGTHTGNVTLASTGATSVTISLNGSAIDCSSAATLPFTEDFEGELSDCWTQIDADGDGYMWEAYGNFAGHSGSCFSSASYINNVGALTPNNWLITPAINLSGNATLTFWVSAQDASYAYEHYGVYVSTTGTNISDFTQMYEETMDANGGPRAQGTWKQKTVDLSAYTGQNVYIAFRHFDCTDGYWLNIDDIEVSLSDGIANIDNDKVNVYPNPAHNYINVNATSNISNVEVYTIAGQKVADFTANGTSTVISTSELSNGMYMMRINTENGTINKKFSVVR